MNTKQILSHPTSPVRPTVDLEGRKVEDNLLFFRFPTHIGDILNGHSDILASKKPLTKSVRVRDSMLALAVGLVIGFLIHMFAHPSTTLLLVAAYGGPVLVCVITMSLINSYGGYNYYIGKYGFAMYWCVNHPGNIKKADEFSFDHITDLYSTSVEVSSNFVYQYTSFTFKLVDRSTGKNVYEINDRFDKRQAIYETEIMYRFGRAIEKRWTAYLVENMNSELAKHGHISFYHPTTFGKKHEPFIELSPGKITFTKKKGESFVYQALDIQRISRIGNVLVIQHKNFQRVNLLFRNGNEDHIPLDTIGNRAFFLIAFEKLMGIRIG